MSFQAIQAAYPAIFSWIYVHGARVLIILAVAVVLDFFLTRLISHSDFGPSDAAGKPQNRYLPAVSEEQKKRVQTIINIVGGALSFAIYTIALLTVLPELGVSMAPILAGVGLAGLAVGMAAKDILTDFISGLFILVEDQFGIGDQVILAGIEGRVKEMTLRRTVIEGGGGVLHIIPNREIKVVTRRINKM